jgi:carbamoyltransferase
MKVLAFSPLDKDSTVAIAEDGVVLFAAAEERFTRVKLQDGFPWRALEAGLAYTAIKLEDLDQVVYPFLPWEEETRRFTRNLQRERDFLDEAALSATTDLLKVARERVPNRSDAIPGLGHPNERMEKSFAKSFAYKVLARESVVSRNVAKRGSRLWGADASEFHRQWQDELESALTELGLFDRLRRVEHHLSHAANAYYTSGFDEALVVTLDGYGSGLAGSVSIGRNGQLRRVHCLEYPHSLGTFYESVTSALGFKPSRHEGKIVGLAAYGDPAVLGGVLRARVRTEPGTFRILENNNLYFSRMLASEFPKVDVAAAYQRVLEETATAYVGHYIERTGLHNLVLSGGVVANVKLNQRLREIPGVTGIFIHPNMGDGGCGVGAAMAPATEAEGRTAGSISDVYWGPDYSEREMDTALRAAHLVFERVVPIENAIAELIAGGRVVARFAGRMEYGPRALGNRSILYHAKEPAVNQWLNQRLGRTEFMPFAPATLFEARHDCYRNMDGCDYAAQFMTITFDCTEQMMRESPAAVHVDGTARPQLVTETSNPSFHRLLTEYRRLTGIPTVINTSFNMHEEPIVCTPADAIRAFLQGNLDYLAMGDFLVRHPTSR